MRLETTGLKFALNAAKHQLSQAKSAYQEADMYYQNLEKAFKSGGISKSDLDKALLDRDVKEQDYQQAKINEQAKQDDLDHATLIALSDGIVSDIMPKTGELTEAGAETIIVQGTGLFAETSISQKDMDKISNGAKAIVEYKNQKLEGSIAYISSLPDFQTFRHTVKIVFSGNHSKLPATIGQTVKIYIESGTVSGIWIPLKHVYNDGDSYVNVIESDRLRKKRIHIIDYSEDKVRVKGLAENDMLITNGAANINEGYKVKITNR
jgi:RND family efflux transporter MFP subunit